MSKPTKKKLCISTDLPVTQATITRYGVGLDVHKLKIAVSVTAQLKSGDIVTVKEHVFNAAPSGIKELVSFLRKYIPVSHYLMECTGIYHLPIYHALKEAFPDSSSKVVAMNPLMIHRRIGDLGKHSDRSDARGLSILTHYDALIRPSYIGSVDFFRLRQMVRMHHKSKKQISRLRNSIHSVLDAENFKFPLDITREWGLQLLDWFIRQDWSFGDAFSSLVDFLKNAGKGYSVLEKRLQHLAEYGDMVLNPHSRFILQMHLSELIYQEGVSAAYLIKAEQLVINDPELLETYKILLQIPSFGSLTALTILVEIGNYQRFTSWKSFVKYCGVVPIIDESGEHRSKGHINRHTNAHIRKVLSQSAGILVNISRRDTDLAKYAYKQYHTRKLPYKKAIVRVANKLARTIYNILVLRIDYDPNYEYIEQKRCDILNKLHSKKTALESHRTRALRRDISLFLVSNYDFLNSTSKYHLKAGFKRVIRKSKYLTSSGGD